MTFDLDDTIVAIASAPGGALRGIVRLSGPQAMACVAGLVRLNDGEALSSIAAPTCCRAVMQVSPELGDVPLVLYLWPTVRSYTRQPSAELHLPGSPPILEAALAAVCRSGARLARPGEFTLRAFLAGRLDLTQAEAVLGVIDAQGQGELIAALDQLAGGLARPLQALREQLLDLLAHLEAGLDFAEEDIEFIVRDELVREMTSARDQIQTIADQMQSRGEAGRLPRVVLTGLPNTGKSSLLNALAGEEAAIVSHQAGTTRDFVTRRLTIDGFNFLVTDTAGIVPEDETDELHAAAQRMSHEQASRADLTVLCLDASRSLMPWEQEQLARASVQAKLVVWTKCDLAATDALAQGIQTSSVTGSGITELRKQIAAALAGVAVETGVVAGTADRCRDSLRLAGAALERALNATSAGEGEELVAAELRLALEELGRVVGAIYTDDVLDRVFSRFCIGK